MMISILLSGIGLCVCLACFFMLRQAPKALAVLMYEKIGTPPKKSHLKNEWIPPHQFEKTLLWLQKKGFTPISIKALKNRSKLPQKPFILAFMGGYRSFIEDLFPLLQKYKVPAVLFIAPALAGTYNAWQSPYEEAWQNLLTREEMALLQKSGLIDFGALALEAEDLTSIPLENAVYSVKESLFRMQTQLGIQTEAFAFWPAKKFDIKTAAEVLPNGFDLPVITPQIGLNAYHKQMDFLNVLQPAKNPWAARYTLWKHR